MPTTTIKKIKGYCPEIDDEKEIDIEFHEVYASGEKYGEIIGRFECDKGSMNNCEYIIKNGDCPIYQSLKLKTK